MAMQQDSQAPSTQAAQQIPDETLYARAVEFNPNTDPEFLQGLSDILGQPGIPPTPDQLSQNRDLVLQATCFFLSRKWNQQIDPARYAEWLSEQQAAQAADNQSIHHEATSIAPTANGIDSPHVPPPSTTIPSPVPRPSAPTPSTAAAASLLTGQPRDQSIANSLDPIHSSVASPVEANNQAQLHSTSTAVPPPPPYPTSFADIVDLITANKPIPGIEDIPDTVLDHGSSKIDRATRRKKPWEKVEETNTTVNSHIEERDGARAPTPSAVPETPTRPTEGVMKILQPNAVPDSGLISRE